MCLRSRDGSSSSSTVRRRPTAGAKWVDRQHGEMPIVIHILGRNAKDVETFGPAAEKADTYRSGNNSSSSSSGSGRSSSRSRRRRRRRRRRRSRERVNDRSIAEDVFGSSRVNTRRRSQYPILGFSSTEGASH